MADSYSERNWIEKKYILYEISLIIVLITFIFVPIFTIIPDVKIFWLGRLFIQSEEVFGEQFGINIRLIRITGIVFLVGYFLILIGYTINTSRKITMSSIQNAARELKKKRRGAIVHLLGCCLCLLGWLIQFNYLTNIAQIWHIERINFSLYFMLSIILILFLVGVLLIFNSQNNKMWRESNKIEYKNNRSISKAFEDILTNTIKRIVIKTTRVLGVTIFLTGVITSIVLFLINTFLAEHNWIKEKYFLTIMGNLFCVCIGFIIYKEINLSIV